MTVLVDVEADLVIVETGLGGEECGEARGSWGCEGGDTEESTPAVT